MKAELYLIDGPWRGRLAIAPRPRGGDWLEDEVKAWRQAGIGVVVSALQTDEVADLEIGREEQLCRENDIEYVTFPITDRGVPWSVAETLELAQRLEAKLQEGTIIAVHCRAGIGRSALLAACVLVVAGVDWETAFDRIRLARGCEVPDTAEQRQWVARFAREFLTVPRR